LGPEHPSGSGPDRPSWPKRLSGLERPERPSGPERPERPSGPTGPERPERPERPSGPTGPERPERPERPSGRALARARRERDRCGAGVSSQSRFSQFHVASAGCAGVQPAFWRACTGGRLPTGQLSCTHPVSAPRKSANPAVE